MAEKKTKTRRKAEPKAKAGPQATLLAHFGKRRSDNGPSAEASSEEAQSSKPPSRPAYGARIIVRAPSSGTDSVTGKRRREESDSSPAGTPSRLRSRSPVVVPSSTPPPEASSPPLVLSSSPPAIRSSSPVILNTSPLSSQPPSPSPPRVTLGDTTDSDGTGLTTHPFFARNKVPKAKIQRTSKSNDKGLGGSQDAPIEIGEDDEGSSKPVHSFFKPRKLAPPVLERTSSGETRGKGKGKERESSAPVRTRKGLGIDPPWPGADSIHVGLGTEVLESKPCPVRRREARLGIPTEISDEATRAWADSYRRSQEDDDILDLTTGGFNPRAAICRPVDEAEEIPPEHAAHPAIARLLDPETGPRHAFTPVTSAQEVLGSKNEIEQLREWLGKLAIKQKELAQEPEPDPEPEAKRRKPKRIERNVIRTRLEKPKRRQRQDRYDSDIVVDDDYVEGIDEPVVYEKVIGNAMVVLGPPGVGKSAAIHACAQELGWSVFEVYAGIGRRGVGANGLAGLIGSVATNHTVGEKDAYDSLILLDEVDVSFEQDTQFWGAVEALVCDSKRAVVMTCNDMYAVREGQISVQQYLELDAADPELAGSYLYAQARAARREAKLPPREAFRELYKMTKYAPRLPGFMMPDLIMHAVPSQLDKIPDLRRALEQVKFWVVHGRGCGPLDNREPLEVRKAWDELGRDVVEYLGDWSEGSVVRGSREPEKVQGTGLVRFADELSWIDAWMERRWERQMQAEEVDRMGPGPDDTVLLGLLELCKPAVRFEEVGIAEYSADAEMALWALRLARRRLERGVGSRARDGLERIKRWNAGWLEEERSTHQENCMVFLNQYILGPGTVRPPQPAVALDIVPVVRAMVHTDDALEASGAVSTRRTRAAKYVRYLTLRSAETHQVAVEAVAATEYQLM